MTGAGWIRVILTISDHFAFLVGSEKCLENMILFFLAHNVREDFKYYFADFVRKGGGGTPPNP